MNIALRYMLSSYLLDQTITAVSPEAEDFGTTITELMEEKIGRAMVAISLLCWQPSSRYYSAFVGLPWQLSLRDWSFYGSPGRLKRGM